MAYVADEFTGRSFGKYELLCRIAVGGMAEIFLGYTKSGPYAFKPVVLKRILQEHREDEHSLQMLIDEAKITATLNHPNVAQVLDLEIAGEDVLLVIEFIRGATFEEVVTAVTEKKEVVPLGFVLSAIRDCAQGLHHAHSHKDSKGVATPIIHRDVTPKNLMVDFAGLGKVLDFGIARAMGAARRTVAGMVRGTSAYMSPEQAVDGKMDIRTDIFSLGTIFHELLTGQRLFYRGNAGKEMAAVYEMEVPAPSTVNRRVPKALDAVVLKALERPLQRRYQTALELVRDLSLAAGSTLWTPDRCAELVNTRFTRRRDEISKLVELMTGGEEELVSGSSTVPGRPMFKLPTRNIPAQGGRSTTPPRVQTATVNAPPGEANTDEVAKRATADEDAGIPTKFFTPNFAKVSQRNLQPIGGNRPPSVPPPAIHAGPIPDMVTGNSEALPTTQMMVTREPATSPSAQAAAPLASPAPIRRQASEARLPRVPEPPITNANGTGTEPGRPRTKVMGTSPAMVVLAAVGALAVGAIGGVLINKEMGGTPAKAAAGAGLGRLSLETDRNAEVQLGENMVAHTPVVDVWMAPGKHQFKLREPNGQWLALDVDVKPDQPTKLKVSLDSLQPVP